LSARYPPTTYGALRSTRVPRVDPVVAAQVELVQLPAALLRRPPPAGLEVHDAHGADPGRVVGPVEQSFDLGQREVGVLLGEREDVAHLQVVARRERCQELVRRHGAGA